MAWRARGRGAVLRRAGPRRRFYRFWLLLQEGLADEGEKGMGMIRAGKGMGEGSEEEAKRQAYSDDEASSAAADDTGSYARSCLHDHGIE
jgi:hypothetical protein